MIVHRPHPYAASGRIPEEVSVTFLSKGERVVIKQTQFVVWDNVEDLDKNLSEE